MDRHVSKVYINPNFNRASTSSVVPKSSVFHVNPAFSQVKQKTQVTQQKSRIYINPNFMPATPHVSHFSMASTNHSGYLSTPASAIETASVPELSPPISQSRYSLVRKEQKHPPPMKTNETAVKPKTTIRISKYQSITIMDVKKRLEAVPPKNTENLEVQRKIEQLPKKYNKYKLLRTNSKTVNKEKVSNQSYKKTVNSKKYFLASRSKYKLSKTAASNKMKKNNIPCPLFRKYGKCIRTEQGKCSFLHDRKHVSICRKFLKGLCFDVDCLLSHDLTSKKMPTCHFYLKGACSKDDCPYLHIKHNENTSICADFLKGYCEKGIECSKRHIDLCPDLATKGICSKSHCPYPHKSKTLKRNANQRNSFPNKVNRIKQPAKLLNKATKNPDLLGRDNAESRYYQESEKSDNKDVCEIKPSRCKLGTLPSFIQL